MKQFMAELYIHLLESQTVFPEKADGLRIFICDIKHAWIR